MRNFFCFYVRNLLWIYLCIMLCFSYMLILDLIPEHVYVEKGKELKWSKHIPVQIIVQQKYDDEKAQEVFHELDYGEYQGECFLFGIIPIKSIRISVVENQFVYASGRVIGVYGKTKGVLVTGVVKLEDMEGTLWSCSEHKIKAGDYILSVNDEEILDKEQLYDYVKNCDGKELVFQIYRNGNIISEKVIPIHTPNGYMVGLWVKDDLAGIGTMTYFTPEQKFGALGHGISDNNTGNLLSLSDGKIYDARILDIDKSENGSPGKIQGYVHYLKNKKYGDVILNSDIGIYGFLDNEDYLAFSEECELYEVMYKQNINLDQALLLSDITGDLQAYDIKICSVNYDPNHLNRQITFEVTDENLKEIAGGIVQGMSGSPIIQDGKIIGAVTHVFVNDPTRGYGIFIEEMLGE